MIQTRRYNLLIALLIGCLGMFCIALALAHPWHTHINVGRTAQDYPYIHRFHTWEYSDYYQVRFRWSRPQAALRFAGSGTLAPLEMRVYSEQPLTMELDDGSSTMAIAVRQGWQRVLLLPQPNNWNGDVQLNMSVPEQKSPSDSRSRGIAIDWIQAHGSNEYPYLGTIVLLGISIALSTLLVAWMLRRTWMGAIAGLALLALYLAVLLAYDGMWRLWLTISSERLVLVFILAWVLAWIFLRLVRWFATQSSIALSPAIPHALTAAAVFAFIVRFGIMSYPLNYIIDLKYHLGRAVMVRAGKFLDLFLPNPMVTPVQWDQSVVVPYAPLYYIISAPISFLPGDAAQLGMMALSSGIDALAVVCVGILVCYAGGSSRAATIAAVLAGIFPFGVLVVASWGHLPTLFGQCLILLTMVAWLHFYPRLHQRKAKQTLLLLMATAFLSYTLVPLFLGITWIVWLILLAVQRKREAFSFLWIGIVAGIIAVALFYGWHISAMIRKTLPVMIEKATEQTPATTKASWSLVQVIQGFWQPLYAQFGTVMLVLALLTLVGMLLTTIKSSIIAKTPVRSLFVAWILTYPFLSLASNAIMTFNWKEVLYMLPLVAILAGMILGKLLQRRQGRIVVFTLLLLTGWNSGMMMLHRIVHAYTELK